MLVRIVLVTFIAVVIIGMSAIFYDYYINTGGSEAKIMARSVVNCLAPHGEILNMEFLQSQKGKLLEYCGYDKNSIKNFYVSVSIKDSSGNELLNLEQGDSGIASIVALYNSGVETTNIAKYAPALFSASYCVNFKSKSDHGNIFVKVIRAYED